MKKDVARTSREAQKKYFCISNEVATRNTLFSRSHTLTSNEESHQQFIHSPNAIYLFIKRVSIATLCLIFSFSPVFSQNWLKVGSGNTPNINCLQEYNGSLYAGGSFLAASGIGANRIAKWNGSTWSALGSGANDDVTALAVYNNKLVVAGQFTKAGGVTGTKAIAQWDGTLWSKLKGGLSGSPLIYSMVVYNNELYIAGVFSSNSTIPSPNIIKWNGTNFLAVGSGANGGVYSLKVYNGKLIAGGEFTQIGGQNISYIAQWNGTSWSQLSGGQLEASTNSSGVLALEVYNSQLYVGGFALVMPGQGIASNILKWDGTNWSFINNSSGIHVPDITGTVSELYSYNNELYVGGSFLTIAFMTVNNIAQWNGSSWSAMGAGFDASINSITSYNGNLFAAGNFVYSGTNFVQSIAVWNPIPVINGISASDTSGCPGLQVSFNDIAIDSATSWSWNFPGGTPSASTAKSPVIQYDIPGTFNVTLTANGPTGPHNYSRTGLISIFSSPVANAGSDVMINSGSSIALSGSGGINYQWHPSTGLSNASTATPVASPITTTTYEMIASDVHGCFDSDQVVVMINNSVVDSNGYFQPVCTAVDSTVWALLDHDNDLIVGGDFITAGGTTVNHISIWNGFYWLPMQTGGIGVNGRVDAISSYKTILDPHPLIYIDDMEVGGTFTLAGNSESSNMASWIFNNTSPPGQWEASYWLDSTVKAIKILQNNLFVGGKFTHVYTTTAVNHYYDPYDGVGSGFNNDVNAIVTYNYVAVAAGDFTASGSTALNHIAISDGYITWSPMSQGMNDEVDALIVYNDNLYAGGKFTTADNIQVNGIAMWNGVSWQAVGTGFNNSNGIPAQVNALAVFNGKLYAGGSFQKAGSVVCNNLSVWNGSNWSPVSTGTNGPIYALAASQGGLFIGGNFTTAGSIAAKNIVKWYDGISPVHADFSIAPDTIYAADSVHLSDLSTGSPVQWDWSFMGGTSSDSTLQNPIVVYDQSGVYNIALTCTDSSNNSSLKSKTVQVLPNLNTLTGYWEYFGDWQGATGNVYASTTYKDQFYVAGEVFHPERTDPSIWNGANFTNLLAGGIFYTQDSIMSMVQFGDKLVMAGSFPSIGGVTANGIASYDGTAYSPLGSGTNKSINTAIVYNNNLIIAGAFTQVNGIAASHIAMYNGSTWSTLGSGTNGIIYCLEVYNGELYAGGEFTLAGGVACSYIAKWNGSTWSVVGSGTDNFVYSMHIWQNKLYIGGSFKMAGSITLNGIGSWDGTTWSPLGSGLTYQTGNFGLPASVYAIQDYHYGLYVGGTFKKAGGLVSNWLTRWDGTHWTPMPVEVNATVHYLGLVNDALLVGGEFTKFGSTTVNFSALWVETTGLLPHAEFKESSTAVCQGTSINFTDNSTGNPNSWSWEFPGGTPSSSSLQNPTVSYDSAGSYSVNLTVNNSYGSSSYSKESYITVAGLPYVNAGPDQFICDTPCATISATNLFPAPNTIYWWSPANLVNSPYAYSWQAIVCPTTTTTYVAYALNSCYSTVVTDTVIVVSGSRPNPVITSSSSQAACGGSLITLSATDADSFKWNIEDGRVFYGSTVTFPAEKISCTTDTASTGYLRAYSSSGCFVDVPFSYGVYPNSDISIQGDGVNVLCPSGASSETLKLYIPNDSTCRSFQWYKNGLPISGATKTIYSVTQPGSYYLVATNIYHGCVATSNTINVSNLPTPAISIVGTSNLCSSGSVTLTTDTAVAPYNKTWYRNGVVISGANSTTLAVTQTGTYQASINYLGCVVYSNTIVINPGALNVTITSGGPTTFCTGGSVVLSTSLTGNGYTYQWKKNNTNISGATTSHYTATATGNYSLKVTSPTCAGTSNAIVVTSVAFPSATITAGGATSFCHGDSVILTANSGTGLTYQWQKGSVNIAGATKKSYTAKTAASYRAVVTNSSNCSKTSNAIKVSIVCRQQENDASNSNEIIAFPNPTSDKITVEGNLKNSGRVDITVLNLLGEVMVKQELNVQSNYLSTTLDLADFSNGIYVIQVVSEGEEKYFRIVKE